MSETGVDTAVKDGEYALWAEFVPNAAWVLAPLEVQLESIEIVSGQGVNVPIQMLHFKEDYDCGGRFLSMFIVAGGKCRLAEHPQVLLHRQRKTDASQEMEDHGVPF